MDGGMGARDAPQGASPTTAEQKYASTRLADLESGNAIPV